MNTSRQNGIHRRGLAVTLLALAAAQMITAGGARARDVDLNAFEATAPTYQSRLPRSTCAGPVDDGTGESSCGSMTGGPAGGYTSRN